MKYNFKNISHISIGSSATSPLGIECASISFHQIHFQSKVYSAINYKHIDSNLIDRLTMNEFEKSKQRRRKKRKKKKNKRKPTENSVSGYFVSLLKRFELDTRMCHALNIIDVCLLALV